MADDRLIKDLPAITSLASGDFIPAQSPASNEAGKATVSQIVAAGLPTGMTMGDLLAWSTATNAWAPLPFAPQAAALAGGAAGSIPYQANTNDTAMLPIGTTGQVLTVGANGTPGWANGLPAYTAADLGKGLVIQSDGTLAWLLSNSPTSAVNAANAIKDFSGNYVQYSKLSSYGHNFFGLTVPNLTGLTYQDNLFIDRVLIGNRCPALTSISAPVCRQISTIEITGHSTISSVSFPFLTSARSISIYNNPNLSTAAFGKLTEVLTDVWIYGNPKLLTMQFFPGSGAKIFGNFNLRDNGLDEGTINSIFAALKNGQDQYGPYGRYKSVNVSGGTNASLNNGIQGWWDAQELVERGCTVTHNGTPFTSTKRVSYIPNFDTVADPGKVVAVKVDGTGLEWVSGVFTGTASSLIVGNKIKNPNIRTMNSFSLSSSSCTEIDLPGLFATTNIAIHSNSALTSVLIGATQTSEIYVDSNATLQGIYLFNLLRLDSNGTSQIGGASITGLNLSSLMSSGSLYFSNCAAPQLALRSLSVCGGAFSVSGFSQMTALNLDLLERVYYGITLSNCPKLTTADLPHLRYLGDRLDISNCALMTSIKLPEVVTIRATGGATGDAILIGTGMGALTTLTISPLLRACNGHVKVTGAALNQASVDALLVRLAALDGTGGSTAFSNRLVTITGTSAAPSATGVTAKNTLVARGCTVTNN